MYLAQFPLMYGMEMIKLLKIFSLITVDCLVDVSDINYDEACKLLTKTLTGIKTKSIREFEFINNHFNIISSEIDSGCACLALKICVSLCKNIDAQSINIHIGKKPINNDLSVDIHKDLVELQIYMTTIYLLSSKNITNVYTFDTIVYHVAFLLKKKLFVSQEMDLSKKITTDTKDLYQHFKLFSYHNFVKYFYLDTI